MQILHDTVVEHAIVKHPFEPERCIEQIADVVVFRDKDFGSVYDCTQFVLEYAYHSITRKELEELGICIVYIYENIGLRKCTFDICKDFFEERGLLREYECYFNYFMNIYKV